MVREHQGEHESQWAAMGSIAAKIGCTVETLRRWVRQAEKDSGERAGVKGRLTVCSTPYDQGSLCCWWKAAT